MRAYIIRRLLQGVLVVVMVTFLVFFILHLLPSDPLSLYLSLNELQGLPAEQRAILEHEWGLDKPFYAQYFDWMSGVVRGDLGRSVFEREQVATLIAEKLPVTVHLTSLALLMGCFIGITSGVICALRRGKWIDTVLTAFANLGITLPAFWAGILMIYLFAFQLGWLPVCGYTSPFDDFWLSTRQVIMPVLCLAVFPVAALTRTTRSCMLEVVGQDYIRTAWSKGLRERVVVLRHTVKNGLIPVVTLVGLEVRWLLGGSVVIELVFNIPGIGRLLLTAIFGQDYLVAEGCILIMTLGVVLANLLVDISYGWIDPRIRYT